MPASSETPSGGSHSRSLFRSAANSAANSSRESDTLACDALFEEVSDTDMLHVASAVKSAPTNTLDTGLSDAQCLAAYDAHFGAAGPRGTKRKRPATQLQRSHQRNKPAKKAVRAARSKKLGKPLVFKLTLQHDHPDPHVLSTNPHNRRRRQQRAAAAPRKRHAAAGRALAVLSQHAQHVLASHRSTEGLMQRGDSLTFQHVLGRANRFFDSRGEKGLSPDLFDDKLKNDAVLLQFCYELSVDPLSVNLQWYVDCGLLSQEPIPVLEGQHRANFYVRADQHDTKASLTRQLSDYRRKHRADVHLAAVLTDELERLPADAAPSLLYAGMAVNGDGFSRQQEDAVDKEGRWSRRGAWSADRDVAVYNIPRLSRCLSSPLDWRHDRRLAAIERLLVGCLGHCSMNSASGGPYPWVALNEKQVSDVAKMQAFVRETQQLRERATSKPSRQIRYEASSAVQAQTFQDIDGQPIPYTSLRTIDEQATSSFRRGYTRIVGMRAMKDNTKEGLFGIEKDSELHIPLFHGRNGGSAGQVSRQMFCLSCGEDGDRLFLRPADGNDSNNPPYVDLWRYTLVHKDIFRAVAYLSRTLHLLGPCVLLVHSSKVWNIVQTGLLASWCEGAPESDIEAFYERNCEDALSRILARSQANGTRKWKDWKDVDFIESIGSVSCRPIAPGTYAAAIPAFDFGAYKRAPAFFPAFANVFLCTVLAYQVTVAVASAYADRSYLHVRQLVQESRKAIQDLGLSDHQQQANNTLRQLMEAWLSLRSLDAHARKRINRTALDRSLLSSKIRKQTLAKGIKLRGPIKSLERCKQAALLVQQARDATAEGRAAKLSKRAIKSAMPWESAWFEYVVSRPVIGTDLDTSCAGANQGQRSPAAAANQKAGTESRDRRRRFGGSPEECLTGAWLSCLPSEAKYLCYCLEGASGCQVGVWIATNAVHTCAPKCPSDELHLFVHPTPDNALSLQSIPPTPARPFSAEEAPSAPARGHQRDLMTSLVNAAPVFTVVDEDVDITRIVTEDCGITLEQWRSRDAYVDRDFPKHVFQELKEKDEKIQAKARREEKGPRSKRKGANPAVANISLARGDCESEFFGSMELLTHPSGAHILRKLMDQAPSQALLAAPVICFLSGDHRRDLEIAAHDQGLEAGYMLWLKSEEDKATSDTDFRHKLTGFLQRQAENIANAIMDRQPFEPLPVPPQHFAKTVSHSVAFP